jgi:uncharacterized protein YbaR (Trm112 family)
VKRSLLPILCCPVCKGDLELRVVEEKDDDIIEGSLVCEACGVEYPIRESIPNLLPKTDQE